MYSDKFLTICLCRTQEKTQGLSQTEGISHLGPSYPQRCRKDYCGVRRHLRGHNRSSLCGSSHLASCDYVSFSRFLNDPDIWILYQLQLRMDVLTLQAELGSSSDLESRNEKVSFFFFHCKPRDMKSTDFNWFANWGFTLRTSLWSIMVCPW